MPSRRRTEAEDLRDGIITALGMRRGQGDRVRVHLDGRVALNLAAAVADGAGLRVGESLSAEKQRELRLLDIPYLARERALRLLEVRDRSEREVETRLRRAGFEPAVAAGTVAWLRDLGYLEDRRFAAKYAAEKQRAGWGPRRIRSELAGKGVERSALEEALRGLEDESANAEHGEEALVGIVRKRFSAQFAAEPAAAERRLAGFLGRRGYDWETIGRMAKMMRAEALPGGTPSSLP